MPWNVGVDDPEALESCLPKVGRVNHLASERTKGEYRCD